MDELSSNGIQTFRSGHTRSGNSVAQAVNRLRSIFRAPHPERSLRRVGISLLSRPPFHPERIAKGRRPAFTSCVAVSTATQTISKAIFPFALVLTREGRLIRLP